MPDRSSFESKLDVVVLWLAVVGTGTVGGLLLGAAGHLVAPAISVELQKVIGAAVGFVGACRWCATVGRRWLADDAASLHGEAQLNLTVLNGNVALSRPVRMVRSKMS